MAVADTPSVQFFAGPDGRRVAYATHGQGPWLVCPAWWVSHLEEDWNDPPFRDFFERLAEHSTVVRYDRPGVGLSDRERGEMTLESEVEVLTALIDRLGADRVSMFAVSCAGPPALQFAASHPQRVDRIVLYGSYADGADIAAPEVQEAMRTLVEAHWGVGSKTLASIFNPSLSGEENDQFSRRQRVSTDAAMASALLQLTYDMNAVEALDRVDCPALVIHRRKDKAIPFEAGRRLAAGLAGASLVPLDGAVHPPWEGPDEILPTMTAFLYPDASPTEALPERPTSGPGSGNGPESDRPGGESGRRFDRANRELWIDGTKHSLTPLEHGLLSYLTANADRVVTRDDALRDVWEQPFGGSNVVDAVVRTLRRKLGPCAAAIETVKGHGYRYLPGVLDD